MSRDPILYSFRRCPYAMRARLAICSAGIRVQLREILLRDKALAFLETSPSGTVPCLYIPDEQVIDESLDIMLWALTHSDPENWLCPEKGSVEEVLALVSDIDGPFKRHLDRYKYHTRYENADRAQEQKAAATLLENLNNRLAKGHDWLFGTRACLADYAILPFIRQFANVDRDWFDKQDWSALKTWLERFETSVRFSMIMEKYTPWKPADDILFFGANPVDVVS